LRLQATFRGILGLAMENIKWRHIGIFALFVLDSFILDRVLKEYLLYSLDSRLEIIPNVFALTIQENPGIAFSIKLPYYLQLILAPALILVGIKLAFDYLDLNNKFVLVVLGVIVGGALGNFVDRVMYSGVIDYISFWHYPVFNLADVFIVVGIFIIIAFYGKIKRV